MPEFRKLTPAEGDELLAQIARRDPYGQNLATAQPGDVFMVSLGEGERGSVVAARVQRALRLLGEAAVWIRGAGDGQTRYFQVHEKRLNPARPGALPEPPAGDRASTGRPASKPGDGATPPPVAPSPDALTRVALSDGVDLDLPEKQRAYAQWLGDAGIRLMGQVVIYPGAKLATRRGHPVRLPDRDWKLLAPLVARPREFATTADLAAAMALRPSSVMAAISELRTRLGEEAIRTVKGQGYGLAIATEEVTDPAT